MVDVEDTTGSLTTWLRRAGAKQGSVLVLRPDKFVFGVSDGPTADLTRALVAQLGLEHPASGLGSASGARDHEGSSAAPHGVLAAVGEQEPGDERAELVG